MFSIKHKAGKSMSYEEAARLAKLEADEVRHGVSVTKSQMIVNQAENGNEKS